MFSIKMFPFSNIVFRWAFQWFHLMSWWIQYISSSSMHNLMFSSHMFESSIQFISKSSIHDLICSSPTFKNSTSHIFKNSMHMFKNSTHELNTSSHDLKISSYDFNNHVKSFGIIKHKIFAYFHVNVRHFFNVLNVFFVLILRNFVCFHMF